MTSVPFTRSLVEAAGLSPTGELDYASIVRILKSVDARLMPLENQSGALEAAIAAVRKVGLDRINEVLVPAIQLVFKIQSMGFLVARSGSAVTLADGDVLTFVIDEEQGRALFTPGPFIAVTREANTDDYAICRTISYDQASGVLICQVLSFAGAPGPHSDWVIGALAGATIAQQVMLEAAKVIRDEIESDRAAVATDRGTVAGDKATTAGHKADAATSASQALASRNAAAVDRAAVATDRAAVAAGLATIVGGPVVSVDGKTGIVYTDPIAAAGIEPTLDLDLSDINGAPFNGVFTRATAGGYRQNAKGLLVPTGINEPVIDFDANGKARGAGFYGAYTNHFLYSEQFDNVAWLKWQTTIIPNAAVGPTGEQTLAKLVANNFAGSHVLAASPITGLADNAVLTGSIIAKPAGYNRMLLQGRTKGGGYCGVGFDLLAGVITSESAGAKGFIEKQFDGSFRCSITWNIGSGSAIAAFGTEFCILNDAISTSFVGDGSSGLLLGHAQLTPTAFAVPYVPTTSSAAVRNADGFSISGADFTDFFNPTEGTLFVEALAPIGATTFPILASLDDGSGNNRHIINYLGSASQISCSTEVGGVTQAGASMALPPGSAFRIARSYKVNSFLAALNGSSFPADLSGSLPSGLNRLAVGTGFNSTVTWWGEHIRRLIYWPKAFDATTLQRMTA